MTAHDPRVTLTEAEIERLCDALEDSDAEYRVEQRVAREVERLIAARLAPIRALAEGAGDLDNGILVWDLRAALDASSAPVSASQDHDWHQPLTHCHCGRVIPCRHHDGAEGQGEGEKAGEGCEYIPRSHWTGLPNYPRWAACRCGWESPIQRTTWSDAGEDHRDHVKEQTR